MSKLPSLHVSAPEPVQITDEQITEFEHRNGEAVNLLRILGQDFKRAAEAVREGDEYDGRVFVRCVGALLDAIGFCMREVAINVCSLYGEKLNPFLQEKATDRSTSNHYRMEATYRLLQEFLPDSPLSEWDPQRWTDLHRVIQIRNRLVHPTKVEDLKLTSEDFDLIFKVSVKFLQDMTKFCLWCREGQQRLMWARGGQRVRIAPKIGRNDLCLCKSGLKYKNCCGRQRAKA